MEILLVDDDEGDVLMIREALSSATPPVRLTVLSDGSDVLPYRRKEGEHARASRPDLILLDRAGTDARRWQRSRGTWICAASLSWC